MKRLTVFSIILSMGLFSLGFTFKTSDEEALKSVYEYKMETLDGELYDFAQLKGKRVLFVNTASKCGFTYQYEELQKLYEQYKDKDFMVIGFPSNNFGFQEPGSDEKIANFCQKNYGVSFPLMTKSSVKGKNKNALYKWLTSKEQNGVEDAKVSWNFNKFLVDENGKWVAHYGSKTSPLSDEIIAFAERK